MSKENKTEEKQAVPARPNRVPLASQNRIGIKERPGYKRRLVNEVGDKIQRMELAGWSVVKGTENLDVRERTGDAAPVGEALRVPVGNGQYAVWMEIPLEYFNEDQAAKYSKVKDELDRIDSTGVLSGRTPFDNNDIKVS